MAENERDITREFLRNIMGGYEEPDQNVINEQTSMPPLDLQSFSEPIEPSAPWPSDGEDRIAAALADPRLSVQEKFKPAQDIVKKPPCCFDIYFLCFV